MLDRPQPRHFRTIFISDVHLGSRGCQARLLLDFMRFHDAEQIFLVGDIVDGWRLRRGWYWPQEHNDVVQKLLRKARKGSKVTYIPGNHDEFLRDYLGSHFGGVEVVDRTIHETADGKRFLIIHGDQFDVVVRHSRWLAHVGDTAYATVLVLNTLFNRVRRRLGFDYWSLSAYLKFKVKNAVNYIGAFEDALAGAARKEGADGVVCGHIHHARIVDMSGFQYINTGDWVESCTAIAETNEGVFELIKWSPPTVPRQGRRLRLRRRRVEQPVDNPQSLP
jgi:UDP-2,3-diacylglucosamine pyrophosphatase LpxH